MNRSIYPIPIQQLLRKHGVEPKKSLGQNFITDQSLCPRIASIITADYVVEIGAGAGALTAQLAERCKKVVALEVDTRILPVLKETLVGIDNVEIVVADALKTDFSKLISSQFPPDSTVAIAGNLPYNITSPLLLKLLEAHLPISEMVVMVQKEAAVRLTSEEGTRESGAAVLTLRYFTEPEILFDVPKSCFFPQPEVVSSVMRLKLKKTDMSLEAEKKMFSVIKAAYSQRRKTAVNAIVSTLRMPKETVERAFIQSGIDLNERAERITLANYAVISEILGK